MLAGMDVAIAEERILILADHVTEEVARAKGWAHRTQAFGAMVKMAGLLGRPKDEDYELVYAEKRLEPFWRITVHAISRYERAAAYPIQLRPEVKAVTIDGQDRPLSDHRIVLAGQESCEEETRREVLVDGLSGAEGGKLGACLDFPAAEADSALLASLAASHIVVVPPHVKASGLVRDAVARAIGKIEADRILEERVELEVVDLYYRPVYAFRYRRAGKEAVIEVDALTGEVSTAGSTFEQHLGKILEPKFLLELGSEAANIFIPGANVARIALVKGLELREQRAAARER
jgi:hypothetical protein